MTYGTVIQIHLGIQTTFNGRFATYLDLAFSNTRTRARFTISREISVHIGNKNDIGVLKPTEAYKPTPRIPRQTVAKVTEGELPPALNAIPYETVLHREPMPNYLRDILASKCSVKEALKQLRGVYVSPDLTMATYVERLKSLLWIEEYQLE